MLQTHTVLWNIAVILRPEESQLLVVFTGVDVASGSQAENFVRKWAVQDSRFTVAGKHSVHLLMVDRLDTMDVYINGQQAILTHATLAGVGEHDMCAH